MPFKGPAESDFKEQHLFSGLPQILDIRSEIPITVIEIIRKMTNKRPSDRYSSVEEVIAAFDKILEQPATKSLDVSSLLTKVHKKISAAAEAELKEKQAREVYNEKQKVLNYSIHQLFIKFSTVADAINNLSDSNQVILKKSIAAGNASASSLSLSFMGKSIRVSFYNQDIIPNYIKEREEKYYRTSSKHLWHGTG
ncbi:MAG: hypothetical protein IPP99_12385 [Chitinophagaceae bacterium]|nr:hypothetical protein [Chitinophagaceae bacterium]